MSRSEILNPQTTIVLLLACLALIVLSHPFAPLWYDENYSLIAFVARGPQEFLLDYHRPNNHMLYTLGQWLWRGIAGDDVFLNRLFPLAGTLLAVPALYLAGQRLHSKLAGLLAVLLFATSHVVGNFATQIRGYGLSFGLIALVLGCAAAWWRSKYRSLWAGAGYAIAGALAVAVMPTNAIFVAAIGTWLILQVRPLEPKRLCPVAITAVLPAVGLGIYVPVWEQFTAVVSHGGWYTYQRFAGELCWDLFVIDMPWLLPITATGLWFLRQDTLRHALLLMLALSAATLLVPLVGSVPWPRNYVPLVPIMTTIAAVCLAALVSRVDTARYPRYAAAAMAAVVLLAGLRELGLYWSRDARWNDVHSRPTTLIDQYQHLPNYNSFEIQHAVSQLPGDSVLLVPTDVYWDMAHVLTRDSPMVKPALLCAVKEQQVECRRTGTMANKANQLYVLDWDTLRPPQLLEVFSGVVGLPEDLELQPVLDSKQFKLWVGAVNIDIR